jgi:hypothetical protein
LDGNVHLLSPSAGARSRQEDYTPRGEKGGPTFSAQTRPAMNSPGYCAAPHEMGFESGPIVTLFNSAHIYYN